MGFHLFIYLFYFCLGGELHSLSFDFLGWIGCGFCVSMEISSFEYSSNSWNSFCWWFICLYSHWPYFKESRILCKCWHHCRTGERFFLFFPFLSIIVVMFQFQLCFTVLFSFLFLATCHNYVLIIIFCY